MNRMARRRFAPLAEYPTPAPTRIELVTRSDECARFVIDELAVERTYDADLEVVLDLYFAYDPDLEVVLELVDDLEDEWFGAYDETREYIAPFETFDEQPTSPFRKLGNWLLGRAAA